MWLFSLPIAVYFFGLSVLYARLPLIMINMILSFLIGKNLQKRYNTARFY